MTKTKRKTKRPRKKEGYIYILQNPALKEGWHKIGKTTRSPEVRVREISRGTGVPIPYEIKYQVFVSDCHAAEKQIHANLNHLRPADNREFFVLPLKDAIDAVNTVARKYPTAKRAKLLTLASPPPSLGVTIALELFPSLFLQTHGVGHFYAKRPPVGIGLMLLYWGGAYALWSALPLFDNIIAIGVLWVAVAALSVTLHIVLFRAQTAASQNAQEFSVLKALSRAIFSKKPST